MSDLISREALKEVIYTIKQIGYDTENKPLFDYVELPDLIKVIDNAPTVEPTFGMFRAMMCDTCQSYATNRAIAKLADDFTRPQGEWEDYSVDFYKCPECGYLLNKDCPCCQNKVILPKGGAE